MSDSVCVHKNIKILTSTYLSVSVHLKNGNFAQSVFDSVCTHKIWKLRLECVLQCLYTQKNVSDSIFTHKNIKTDQNVSDGIFPHKNIKTDQNVSYRIGTHKHIEALPKMFLTASLRRKTQKLRLECVLECLYLTHNLESFDQTVSGSTCTSMEFLTRTCLTVSVQAKCGSF